MISSLVYREEYKDEWEMGETPTCRKKLPVFT